MEDKQASERQKLNEMMSEAEKQAIEIIETRYPKHIATSLEVKLLVGSIMPNNSLFDGCKINRVSVRRQNRQERRKVNLATLTNPSQFDKSDIAMTKMMMLITSISAVDEAGTITHGPYEWNDIPAEMRSAFINELDIIDEDEILEGITALEYGFGSQKEFYTSSAFRELKQRQDETFRETES